MTNKWWEKTVEYAFVVAAFKTNKCDFAVPFAGKEERLVGDAAFANASKFVLIEFKRDKDQIETEKSLFHNYAVAEKQLQNYKHHFIVFGSTSQTEVMQFQINAQTYFNSEPLNSALDCLAQGVGREKFDEYLNLLAALKKVDDRGSSGHATPQAISTVIGISNNGEMIGAASIQEYAPNLFGSPTDNYDNAPKSTSNSNIPRM